MSEDFVTKTIEGIIDREGGYVDHPNDPGGATNWGITERVARDHHYEGDMRDMPREVAFQIYYETYWLTPGFALVAEHSFVVAEELMDTGVNCGTRVASKMLQRCLNTFNRGQRDYPDLAVDGAIGKRTCVALEAFLKKREKPGEVVLHRALNCLQGARYVELAEANEKLEDFTFGWLLHRVE